MFIDKQGKLFGKINIIDLLILVVLVLAIVILGAKFLGGGKGQDAQVLEMKFHIEEIDTWVTEKVQIGDGLYDGTYEQNLGKVTNVETAPSKTWGLNQDGQYVLSSREGYQSMTITGEVLGTKTDVGCKVGGELYGVGHSMVLYAGDAKLYLRVQDISVKE